MKVTFHVILDHRYEKDDKLIYLRPYYNRKRYPYVPTGLTVPMKIWKKYQKGNLNMSVKEERTFSYELGEVLERAETAAGRMNDFDYDTWKTLFRIDNKETISIATGFDLKINTIKNKRNKASYETAKQKFLSFPTPRPLNTIDDKYLFEVEEWMEHEEELAWSSIGIYMRSLRAVFNHCKKVGLIDNYPFDKYKPPVAENTKKALYPDEIKKLLEYESEDYYNQRAVDFWKICFLMFGKYPSDLMALKWDQFRGDCIVFTHRVKTSRMRTRKEFEVPITPLLQELLDKWANGQDDYVFNFGNYSAWNRRVNKRLRDIGEDLGIKVKLTLQSARHSVATKLLHAGADRGFLREALGHKTFKTTDNYINSFANDYNREFAKKLIE